MTPQHLHADVNEFAGRHNDRPRHTKDQIERIVQGMNTKRLQYGTLRQDNIPLRTVSSQNGGRTYLDLG